MSFVSYVHPAFQADPYVSPDPRLEPPREGERKGKQQQENGKEGLEIHSDDDDSINNIKKNVEDII
eukprot:Pgem_evm1s10690